MSEVEIFENERATNYDEFVTNWIPSYHHFISLIPGLLKESSDKDLLVVGCGTGNEISRLLEANKSWKVTGVDPSPEMISQAKRKLEKYPNVSLIDGEISRLPKKQSFSAATLLLVLHFLPDDGSKSKLLHEIASRLNPRAPLVILDITGTRQQIRDNLHILRHMIPAETDPAEVEERLRRIENELHHVSESRLTELLELAGFEAPVRFFQTAIYMGWMTRKNSVQTK